MPTTQMRNDAYRALVHVNEALDPEGQEDLNTILLGLSQDGLNRDTEALRALVNGLPGGTLLVRSYERMSGTGLTAPGGPVTTWDWTTQMIEEDRLRLQGMGSSEEE